MEQDTTLATCLRQYRLLILALVATFVFHSALLFSGTFRGTYDAFVHIFFADHYARDWWSLWETRWYTGFTMVSYPPLTHQLTALLSYPFSLPTGFIIVMISSTVLTTLGVYRFSRLWVDHQAASYAALLAVFSSSIAETVHVFGQSPTMFVIGVILNAMPFVWRYVEDGETKNLFCVWALLMVACAGHHVTTIFGMVFFCGPILATLLLKKFRTPLLIEDELEPHSWTLVEAVRRRVRRVMPAFIRCGIFGIGFIIIAITTVLPYWIWSRSDPITQITIPHGSRENFITNPNIGLMFFLIPWGMQLFVLPYALYKGFSTKNWILASSLAMMILLGTGGTTPIPAMLLQGAFYILTLDRFTFWATIVILPFAGQFVDSLVAGRFGKWITAHFGYLWKWATIVLLGGGLIATAIFVGNLTQFRKFQPDSLDMLPIVEFMAKDNHDQWRYMTLGFGDQMAWLAAQTTALNVEGNYHSARRLPELTTTPIERLDGAKYQSVPGLGSLHQILSNPQQYSLKYIFVNDDFYLPLLHFYGWHSLGALENDVEVWERADVPSLPAAIPQVEYPTWQRIMWGTLPVASLGVTLFVFLVTAIIPIHPTRWIGIRWFFKHDWIRHWLLDQPANLTHQPENDWQFWRKYSDRLPSININPQPYYKFAGLLLLIAVVGGVLYGVVNVVQFQQSPEQVILNYYDDVDFKRFSNSYQWLETDLSQVEYLRSLSLRGGLVASFSKLENIYIEIDTISDDYAEATVTLEWLTALGTYPETVQHDLRLIDNRWRILFDNTELEDPVDTLITRTEPQFLFDTPLPSFVEGDLNRGILDRSLLSVSDVRVVFRDDIPIGFFPESYDLDRVTGRWDGLLSVVGFVQNRDVYPAHVTVSAIFRDSDGVRIAQANAAAEFLHQLLPDEVSPFRIDLVGADATALLDLEEIAEVELIVRGTPTHYNLSRTILVLDETTLYNSGTQSVDVPRLLYSHFDEAMRLLWVENVYLEQAIMPTNTIEMSLPPSVSDIRVLDIPVELTGPRLETWNNTIDLIYYRILPTGFIR